jgi:hypothetical protein
MKTTETLTEALAGLKTEGYTEDFNLAPDCLECHAGTFQIFHNEFEIDRYYRFEGMTDPADEVVLYAISSDKFQMKGTLVNGFGIYADGITQEMVEKLKIHR